MNIDMVDFNKVAVIDRLPDIQVDKEELAMWLLDQRLKMESDRQEWLHRHRKYLSQWDDFVTSNREGPWKGSSNFHLPLTMQMVKALQARMRQAMLAVRPWWMIMPLEKLDRERVKKIDVVMRWAMNNYVNEFKGIESLVDDWTMDFVTVGWGVVKRRWSVKQRKAIVFEEVMDSVAELANAKENDDIEVVGKEVEKLITYFDGPMIETVAHEDIFFPGAMNDVSDLNEPVCICEDFRLDKSELKLRAETGLYDKDAVERVIEKGMSRGPKNKDADEVKRTQDRYQGVKTVDADAGVDEAHMSQFSFRYDVDNDGIAEEMVASVDLTTNEIVRLTYLDRITKTGKRGYHKADLIRRPRRSYSLGLVELLYPLNKEMDAMHNMRVDFGTLTNVPFFFFRSTSDLDRNSFNIEPGKGIPVDDPQNDVVIPKFGNSTAWGQQEEQSLSQWAEKLTSLTSLNLGLPTQTVGSSRTASGTSMLLNESNLNVDVMLSRFKIAYSDMLKGLLADLQERLPDDVQVRVLGATGDQEFDSEGMPKMLEPTRQDIAGRVDFLMMANSQNSNRELEKQNAMLQVQMLLNPVLLNTGIVGPGEIYNNFKNLLEKHGAQAIDELLKKPENVMTPLSTRDEIAAITQGMVPVIVMNDPNHQKKINTIQAFVRTDEFKEGLQKGVNHPNSLNAANSAIEIHQQHLTAISSQMGPQNSTGIQVSPSLGARQSGVVGGSGQPVSTEAAQAQGGQVEVQ